MKNNNKNEFGGNDLRLTPIQRDSLMELGNIGSGNAITALSQLLNKKIEVSLTAVDLIPFWKLPDEFGGIDIEIFCILTLIKESQKLLILQLYTRDSVKNLIECLSEEGSNKIQEMKVLSDLDDFILSSIAEVGNILSSHYANALADLMQIKLIPQIPDVAFDTLGAIMDAVIAGNAKTVDLMLMINTKMKIEDLNMSGMLVFLPEVETLSNLFKAIHIE